MDNGIRFISGPAEVGLDAAAAEPARHVERNTILRSQLFAKYASEAFWDHKDNLPLAVKLV